MAPKIVPVKESKNAAGVLFRLRSKDTPTGISTETLAELVDVLGMSKTEVIHYALRELANKHLSKCKEV